MMVVYPRKDDYVERQRQVNLFHSDGTFEGPGDVEAARLWVTEARNALPSGRGSVLEVGCRTGLACWHIARALPDAQVVGVDVVPEFINIAAYRMPTNGLSYSVVDVHALGDSGPHDLVFSDAVLEHTHDASLAMGECLRVTKPGGTMVARIDLCPMHSQPNPSHYTVGTTAEWWAGVAAKLINGGGGDVLTWCRLGDAVVLRVVRGK